MPPRKTVIIMTDTQRTDMLGCYGHPEMKTPNLDRLAAEGVRFENAYTCQPVCGPARAALFTGTWPHINNGWANSMALDVKTRTVGERVQELGLHTAYIGKWHLDGGDYFGEGVCPNGWDDDYWYDMRCYLEELTPEERRLSRQESMNYTEQGVDEEFTFGHRVANRAIDFLDRFGADDFLLVVSFDEPHGPFLTPKRFLDMHAETRIPWRENMADPLANKPAHQRVWAGSRLEEENRKELELRRQSFFACNSFVDYEIGRVLDAIDCSAPDTLVIYTSDHGDMLQSHRLCGKGPAMYDEITKIPFIVKWPGVVEPGSVSASLVSHIDVVLTVLDVSGCEELPAVLQGKSMCPLLEQPASVLNDEIFVEFGRYEIDHDGFGGFQPLRCVRNERYKLVINLLWEDELYDMQDDPQELNNLIGQPAFVAIRNRLHDRLIDWMNETRDPFRGYCWLRRPWRTDAPEPTWEFTGHTRQREPDSGEQRQLDYDTGLPMEPAPEFHFMFRGRMGERQDNTRGVRDKCFVYLKNYMPYAPREQHLEYAWLLKAMQAWEQYDLDGNTDAVTGRYFRPKEDTEELYDSVNDPDNIHNLIHEPEYAAQVDKMRQALHDWQLQIRDAGLLPEPEMNRRAQQAGITIYEVAQNAELYDVSGYLNASDLTLQRDAQNLSVFIDLLGSSDSGLRYWAAVGCLLLKEKAAPAASALRSVLVDESHDVRMIAAWSLIQLGEKDVGLAALETVLRDGSYAMDSALNVLDWMGKDARPLMSAVQALPERAGPLRGYLLKKYETEDNMRFPESNDGGR